MRNQLYESEAKSQACPGSQICWFMLGLPNSEFCFSSKLQNKICIVVIWSFCCDNRSVERCDVFSNGCMVTFPIFSKQNTDVLLLIRLLYINVRLLWS